MLTTSTQRLARLHYQPNGFRILAAGDHVLCAASGQRVALEDLRYWSVDRQEAYATALLATDAMMAAQGQARPR